MQAKMARRPLSLTGFTAFVLIVTISTSHGKHTGWKSPRTLRAMTEFSTSCGRQEVHMPMIVGGSDVMAGGAPWQARLRYVPLGYHHWCGGAVIAPNWIVTASHCIEDHLGEVFGPEDFTVTVGDVSGPVAPGGPPTDPDDPGEQVLAVKRIILHENFEWRISSIDHDIALMELETPIKYSPFVQPICLPGQGPAEGEICMSTGWGDMSEGSRQGSSALQEVALPILSSAKCREWYSGSVAVLDDNIHLCAGILEGDKAPCQGDSGGPLVCQRTDGAWTLQGVTSFGIGCGRESRPGVFAKVAHYLPWIYRQMSAPEPEPPLPEPTVMPETTTTTTLPPPLTGEVRPETTERITAYITTLRPETGCQDTASWCAEVPAHDCADSSVIRSETCCKTCMTHYTGIEGCEYGDSKSWCKRYTPKHCKSMKNMVTDCCMLCRNVTPQGNGRG